MPFQRTAPPLRNPKHTGPETQPTEHATSIRIMVSTAPEITTPLRVACDRPRVKRLSPTFGNATVAGGSEIPRPPAESRTIRALTSAAPRRAPIPRTRIGRWQPCLHIVRMTYRPTCQMCGEACREMLPKCEASAHFFEKDSREERVILVMGAIMALTSFGE